MAATREHYTYADALITSGIKAFARNGKKTKKNQMVTAAKSAARASAAATIKLDKKLRPNAPKSWNSATAIEVNKRIENIAWKEMQAIYKAALKKRADLNLPEDQNILRNIMHASLFGIPAATKSSSASNISRRHLTLGLTILAGNAIVLGGTSIALADNKSLIAEVNKDVKGYLKGKRTTNISRMDKALG